ncbi:hypothetical protein D9M68_861400 [compost metagenome]
MIPIVVEVVDRILRFRLIEPEDANTLVVIVDFGLVPNVLAGLGMGGIKEDRVAQKVHAGANTSVRADQVALAQHLLVILTGLVYRWPD